MANKTNPPTLGNLTILYPKPKLDLDETWFCRRELDREIPGELVQWKNCLGKVPEI